MATNRNEKVLKAFGKNLKKIRMAKGLTTRQFADLADIAYSQVWTLETGKGDPSLSTLLAICTALEVSLEELIPLEK
ncbi:MAG TPA: helix-turn-helix transcriptional regulator [Chitinophagaceae bacterium]